ncbi:hypothetical protein FOS00_00525 [Bacillus atrophaeus]|nr:hypothetical protein [Bacillus atrophaeus]
MPFFPSGLFVPFLTSASPNLFLLVYTKRDRCVRYFLASPGGLKYVIIIPAPYDYDVKNPNSTGR